MCPWVGAEPHNSQAAEGTDSSTGKRFSEAGPGRPWTLHIFTQLLLYTRGNLAFLPHKYLKTLAQLMVLVLLVRSALQ